MPVCKRFRGPAGRHAGS